MLLFYLSRINQVKSFNRMVSGVASVGTLQVPNPLAINLYVLGYDGNGNISQLNPATKQNLKNYISYYRMLTDAVYIKDAYIINIGIDFEIVVLPNYNSNEVLLKCINELKAYFSVGNEDNVKAFFNYMRKRDLTEEKKKWKIIS